MSQIAGILAQNIKRLRALRGIKQEELAEKSGLSIDTIRNIETGRAWVSRESTAQIAKALKADQTELFRSLSSLKEAPRLPSTKELDAIATLAESLGIDEDRLDLITLALHGKQIDVRILREQFVGLGLEVPAGKRKASSR